MKDHFDREASSLDPHLGWKRIPCSSHVLGEGGLETGSHTDGIDFFRQLMPHATRPPRYDGLRVQAR